MSKIFGQRLKELRVDKNLTQQQLAQYFNTSKVTISAWELDKQEPCIDDIKKLAQIFDTSTDYLLGVVSYDGVATAKYECNGETSTHNRHGEK